MLSRNIKKYRLESGLTQEQLADVLGVSSQAVSKWETTDTYPDGSLLVPMANALGVSLDALFDNEKAYMADLSSNIRTIIQGAGQENRFEVVRDIGWQIERAMFGAGSDGYDPDQIKKIGNSSYIRRDYGFTCISNGRAPFFSVFPDNGSGFAEVIGDGEEMRRIFEILSPKDTMRAAVFVHSRESGYYFDAGFLARECGIGADRIDDVLSDLLELRIVGVQDVELNGERKKLYHTAPSHVMIAMLLFAHELNYKGGYSLQADSRKVPFLR